MSLLGQLVYTSFPKVGYRLYVSTDVPPEIQEAFIQQVVYQHWNSYKPPKAGYRAAYIYQVTSEHTLFGWLYNDGMDDLGRSHVPYFVCYYYSERLHTVQLANIFTWLQTGPIEQIDQPISSSLAPIVTTNLLSYQPVRKGVEIPLLICEQSHAALKQEKLLKLFIPSEQAEILVTLDAQYKQQATDSCHQDIEIGTASLNSQDVYAFLLAAESVTIKPPLIIQQPDDVKDEEPALTVAALKPEPVAASMSHKFYIQGLTLVAVIVVVGVSFVLIKFWQLSAPPIISTEGAGNSTLTSRQSQNKVNQLNKQDRENNFVDVQLNRSVPGFPPATPESIVKAALGEPTKTSKDYLPNIDAAFYDLEPNKITLGYLFDRYSRRIRQTEVSFAQSVDSQIMLATLNGMLGSRANEEIQQGLQQVYERQSNQYPLVVGSMKGVIKRNERDRVYIGLWEINLY